jgi:soluble cytochrome b562
MDPLSNPSTGVLEAELPPAGVIPEISATPEAEPVTATPPETSPAAPPDPEMVALRERFDQLEQRLRDTQRWGHEQSNEAKLARAIVQANQETLEAQRLQQERNAALQPPQLSPERREALLQDPEALEDWQMEREDYLRRTIYAEIAPYLQAAQVAAQVQQPLVEQTAHTVESGLYYRLRAEGVSDKEFQEIRPIAHELLTQHARGNRINYDTLRLNPEAMQVAYSMARERRGIPVRRQAPPPTIGTGAPGAGVGARPPAAKPDKVLRMEESLGVTLDPKFVAGVLAEKR